MFKVKLKKIQRKKSKSMGPAKLIIQTHEIRIRNNHKAKFPTNLMLKEEKLRKNQFKKINNK